MTSTQPEGDLIVEIAGLQKTYARPGLFGKSVARVDALKGVSLSIERGRTLGLAGKSGCGKSTLARCLAGLERADAGQLRINGVDLSRPGERDLRRIRHQVQVIFQDSAAALNPRFTALDLIAEPMAIHGLGTAAERRDRASALMTQVGLPAERLTSRPGQFSGGERQRVAIARALAASPRMLILDEAFSGLDEVTRNRIVALLQDLQTRHGLTYLCISHDLDVLSAFARDVLLMEDGAIVHSRPQPAEAVA